MAALSPQSSARNSGLLYLCACPTAGGVKIACNGRTRTHTHTDTQIAAAFAAFAASFGLWDSLTDSTVTSYPS